jgi:hypothetical protein
VLDVGGALLGGAVLSKEGPQTICHQLQNGKAERHVMARNSTDACTWMAIKRNAVAVIVRYRAGETRQTT